VIVPAPGRFPLFWYLACAVRGVRQDGIFVENSHAYGFELVERLAAVAPAKLIKPIGAYWDKKRELGYLKFKLAGSRCRLELTKDRYPLNLPDSQAFPRFLEDLNRIFHAHRVGFRVRAEAVRVVDAEMVLEPVPGCATEPMRAIPDCEAILPMDRVLVVDVESVDDASDYVSLLAELAERCPKGLAYDSATCVQDGGRRVLSIVRGKRKATFELEGRGGIDLRFLTAIRSLLAHAKSPYRLVELRSEDQCLRIAFATKAQERALDHAFLLAPRPS